MNLLTSFVASAAVASLSLGGLPLQAEARTYSTDCWILNKDTPEEDLEWFSCQMELYRSSDGVKVFRWVKNDLWMDHAFYSKNGENVFAIVRSNSGFRKKLKYYIDSDGDYRIVEDGNDIFAFTPPKNGTFSTRSIFFGGPDIERGGGRKPDLRPGRTEGADTLRQLFD